MTEIEKNSNANWQKQYSPMLTMKGSLIVKGSSSGICTLSPIIQKGNKIAPLLIKWGRV